MAVLNATTRPPSLTASLCARTKHEASAEGYQSASTRMRWTVAFARASDAPPTVE
jgi:hypothetical protein